MKALLSYATGQFSVTPILYPKGQGGKLMDEAIALVEAAAKPAAVVAVPGATTPPITTGPANVTHILSKHTSVVRAVDFAAERCLETEADVVACFARLNTEPLAVIKAGKKARLQ